MVRRDPNITRRRIYFYRVDVGRNEATGERLAFNHESALDRIAHLVYGDGSAYLEDDDQVTCGWVDRPGRHARVRIADIRRQNLPQLEQLGTLSPLVIDQRAGLAEQVHVVFYDNNVVGSEFNFYGPRIGRVARYLRSKAGIVPLSFEILTRQNIVQQLNELRDIRLFQLRISPSHLDDIRRLDSSVAEMFRSALALGESGRIEVILRPEPYSRRPLPARVREALRALAGRRETLEAADVFKTAGLTEDGAVRVLDLLKDDLVAERPVRRLGDGSRALDPESIYGAIDSAYDELRPALEAASGVQG